MATSLSTFPPGKGHSITTSPRPKVEWDNLDLLAERGNTTREVVELLAHVAGKRTACGILLQEAQLPRDHLIDVRVQLRSRRSRLCLHELLLDLCVCLGARHRPLR